MFIRRCRYTKKQLPNSALTTILLESTGNCKEHQVQALKVWEGFKEEVTFELVRVTQKSTERHEGGMVPIKDICGNTQKPRTWHNKELKEVGVFGKQEAKEWRKKRS